MHRPSITQQAYCWKKNLFFLPNFDSNGEKLWDYQQKIYPLKVCGLRLRLTSFPGILCTCPLILLTLVFPVSASVLIWKMIIITKSCKEVRFRWHFFQYRICTHQNRHSDVNPTRDQSRRIGMMIIFFHISIIFSSGEYLQSLQWPRYCIHKYEIGTILENTKSFCPLISFHMSFSL